MHHQHVTQMGKNRFRLSIRFTKKQFENFMMQVAEEDDILNASVLNPSQALAKSVSNLI